MKTYIFRDREVVVKVNRTMARTSIHILDADTEDLVMIATENVDELKGMPNYVAVKPITEDSLVLNFLVKNQFIAEPSTYLREGTVSLPICKIL